MTPHDRRGFLTGAALVAAVLVLVPVAGTRLASAAEEAPGPRARNVIVVTLDGLRWQELFSGFAAELGSKEQGVASPDSLAHRFDAPTAEARRERLLPFLWKTVAREGQVFGDPSSHCHVRVTNGMLFSYPGYAELLTGVADPRIDSNAKKVNPNVNVLEWLVRRPGFEGEVAAFASWDVFPFILAADRSGIPVNAGGPPVARPEDERQRMLNEFAADLPVYWGSARFDATTMHGALEHLHTHQPRVLYVALDETDEWAHERRYDVYLDAAHRSDRFLRRLWETAQSLPSHRGRTALVVATDHGRGETARDWTDHGEKVPAADRIWVAVMGPDTPPLGLRSGVEATQSQVAATIAHLLGEDFGADLPAVAPPLAGIVR
jgi:hypothetical protein